MLAQPKADLEKETCFEANPIKQPLLTRLSNYFLAFPLAFPFPSWEYKHVRRERKRRKKRERKKEKERKKERKRKKDRRKVKDRKRGWNQSGFLSSVIFVHGCEGKKKKSDDNSGNWATLGKQANGKSGHFLALKIRKREL